MDWVWMLFEIGMACFEVFIMKMLAEGILKRKRKVSKRASIFILTGAAVVSALVSYFMSGVFAVVLAKNVLVITLISVAFCKAKPYWHGIVVLFFLAIAGVLENLAFIIMASVHGVPIIQLSEIGFAHYQAVFLSNLFTFLFVLTVLNFKKSPVHDLSKKQWILLYIPLVFAAFVVFQFVFIIVKANQPITFVYVFSAFFLLFANFMMISLVESTVRRLEDKRKLAAAEAHLSAQREYNVKLKESRAEIQQLSHDFRHHVQAFQLLAERGQYEELSLRINELAQHQSSLRPMLDTGNPMLDALLTAKRDRAEQEHIPCDLKIQIPQNIPIPMIDLCSLLGNALDNAIEACGRAGGGMNPFIELELRAPENVLLCEVKNAVGQLPRRREGRLETLKRDARFHGIGLKSMEECCGRLGGQMGFDFNETVFILRILIPFPLFVQ